jgi:hypothetical protein
MRLAARDLRSSGAPLATCNAEVDRSLWYIRPASVLLVDWPEYGLAGVVMRVTSVDYGKPGDPVIKLSLIEDVFGLDAADYVTPPGSAWEDPSQPPAPMTEQAALTLPYFLAAQGVTTLTGAAYPEVLAGILGASDNEDTYGFELWGEVTLTDGSTEWQSLASLNLVAHAELSAPLVAEASSSSVSFTSFIGTRSPSQGGLAIIGDGTEAENELALITSVGTTYALSRGVLDTVPKAWAAGTPVWFVMADDLIEDPNARSVAEIVNYRLLTRASQGLLSLYIAPLLTYTLTDRPWLPSRPANITIGSVQFNTLASAVNMVGASVVPVTWSNRNRLTEDTQVLGWTEGDVTPETGQTTTITVYKTDGVTVLDTLTGLTGTSHNIPVSSFGSEAFGLVVLTSSRTDSDGTFESLQGHGIYVQVDMAAPVGMAVETDTAFALAPASVRGPGMASETDSSMTLGFARGVGRADETDTALPLTAASGSSTIRSSNITAGASGSVTVTWPTGAAAGDRAIINASSDWAVNTPSGWDTLQQADGSNINGEVMTKVLTSGDISTGSVTITFAGTGSELASCVVFVGAPIVHGVTVSRLFASGSSLASFSDCESGDTLLWFGDSQGGSAPTISRGSTLQTRSSAPYSKINSETLSGAGSVSATFTSAGDNWASSVAVGPTATTTLAVRATKITSVSSASSVVYTFPTGSQAGDMCLICVGHGFAVTVPAGWTQDDLSSGSNYNGAVFHKTLTSGDISTGSVTISFGGSFNGSVQGVTFVGVPTGIRTTAVVRNGSAPVTVTTGSSPVAGDVAFYFGSARSAVATYPSVNRGSVLEKVSTANSPAIIGQEILTSGGAKSAVIGYANSTGTSGDYSAIVVIQP